MHLDVIFLVNTGVTSVPMSRAALRSEPNHEYFDFRVILTSYIRLYLLNFI